MAQVRVIIGLGSNQGDRLQYLRLGVEQLLIGPVPILTSARCSSLYESKALLMPGAPSEWDQPFYNAAISGDTHMSPQDLLAELKRIEQRAGRQYLGVWAPRELDLDILAYGHQIVEEPNLQIPHRELLRRDFALVPLAEIEPEWVWPCAGEWQGKPVRALLSALGMERDDNLKKTRFSLHTTQL